MAIRNRFKAITERYGLTHHLPIRLEREASIPRRTAKKILDNTLERYTTELIEQLCHWLRRHHVTEDLPGALFVYEPPHLLQVLAAPGHVRTYIGAYVQPDPDLVAPLMSQADFELACLFVEQLSGARPATTDNGMPSPRPVHFDPMSVPSHLNPPAAACDVDLPYRPTEVAREMFRVMRRDCRTNLILGSPRANLLTELFLADLVGCDPFAKERAIASPFYMCKPETDNTVASSGFVGTAAPETSVQDGEGILFRREPGRWEFCPVRRGTNDAGIVIVRHDPGRGQTDMVIFGFSSAASSAMSQILREHLDCFWQDLETIKGGVRTSVSLCGFSLRPGRKGPGLVSRPTVHDLEIVRLRLGLVAQRGSRGRG